jgi:4-amino-4-deoxy-L-arabinose transferase-like glycosyltransferase
MNDMSKSLRWSFLVGILIIATFLRFYHFTTVPSGLYPDEAMNGNNAVEVAETGHFQPFYIEDNGREGLYINLVAVTLKVLPASADTAPWAVRLPAAIAGVLTVWGLYLLVAELLGTEVGLLAAFLLATSFWGINFSRIAFRAILAPLLLVWSLWLLTKAFRAAKTRASIIYAALAGIVYAAGFYTYIAYRVTPLLFLLFIPFFHTKPGFWKKTMLFFVVTFIVASPIGWYFAKHPADFFGRTAQISVTAAQNPLHDFTVNVAKEALMFNWHGDYNWRQNISGASELFWPVGILFLIGIAVAAWSLWKSWRRRKEVVTNNVFPPFALLLTFVWIALGILPAAASDEGIPHALRSILALPPAMIFAAIGGVWLYRLMKDRWRWHIAATRSIAIVFLIVVGVFGYVNYFVTWAQNSNVPGAFNENYVTIGQQMNALPTSTQKYVVVNAGGVLERGIPTPAETVMFITHSFTQTDMTAANIHYLLPNQTSSIPAGTPSEDVFYVN